MDPVLDKAFPAGRRRAAQEIIDEAMANELRKMMMKEMRGIFDEMIKEEEKKKTPEDDGIFGAQDPRKMEMTIDQMVANAITGGKYTTAVLKMLFGLVPNLIGR